MTDKAKITKRYETTNYDKFKFIASNRMISENHIKSIMNEIQRKDLRSENPIKISKKFEILEGQHTFEACKKLELSIFYEFSNMTVQDIGAYNSVQRSWKYKDVLNHFCVEGSKDYQILYDISQKYPYPISTLIILLSGDNSRALMESFKRGTFKITQSIKEIESILNKIDDFKKFDNFVYRHKTFLLVYMDLLTHPEFSHNKMIHKTRLVPERFEKQTNQGDYLRMLEDIFNYKIRTQPVRFF